MNKKRSPERRCKQSGWGSRCEHRVWESSIPQSTPTARAGQAGTNKCKPSPAVARARSCACQPWLKKIHRIAAHLEIKRILPIPHLVRHTHSARREFAGSSPPGSRASTSQSSILHKTQHSAWRQFAEQQPTWKSSEYSPSRILYSCASNLTSRSRVPAAKGE